MPLKIIRNLIAKFLKLLIKKSLWGLNTTVLKWLKIPPHIIGGVKYELNIELACHVNSGYKCNIYEFPIVEIIFRPPYMEFGLTPTDSATIHSVNKNYLPFCLKIFDCRFFSSHYFFTSWDYKLIKEVSHYWNYVKYKHPAFYTVRLPYCTRISGKSIILRVGAYYHTLIDAIGGLSFLDKMGLRLDDIDNFVLFEMDRTNYIYIITSIGIPKEKIIIIEHANKGFYFEELIIPNIENKLGNWYLPSILKFIPKANLLNFRKISRIYLIRKDCGKRRVFNQQDVVKFLAKYGFVGITCADYSINEQRSIFENVTHIIGPHGSDLANLIYCRANTHVCELKHYSHSTTMSECYFDIALSYNLIYSILFCQGLIDEKTNGDNDFHVDIQELKRYLNSIF